ncbi:recombinase family protein [Nesterenkonia sp. K-15-9-6]|uniref:recombinase family protein n=1 Tax=Nesterenkonia sp. K-15-9-6 TaxID=3093918 RepID=UPI0040447BA2
MDTEQRRGDGLRGRWVGYARISTADQDPGAQVRALEAAGCDEVAVDRASGVREDRPELLRVLGELQAGDTLVVWKLDRLGRSVQHLIEVGLDLERRGVVFRSMTEAIDTSTAMGRLMLHVLASFAQFERDLISERTTVGLAEAAARGTRLGRPPAMNADMIAAATSMSAAGMGASAIARALGVSRSTVRRNLGRVHEG